MTGATIKHEAVLQDAQENDAPESPVFGDSDADEEFGTVRILSDLHLGHSGTLIEDVRQLAPLIEGADTVVFNGDTIEERCSAFRPKGEKMQAELDVLCAELGAKAIYLAGNHDPDSWPHSILNLCEETVFVTHGHAIINDISPWSRKAGDTARVIDNLWREFEIQDHQSLEDRLELTRKSCHATVVYEPQLGKSLISKLLTVAEEIWPPSRPLAILRTWLQVPRSAQNFAQTYCPNAKFFIMGHTHLPGSCKVGDLRVINTGAFFLVLNARMVELHGDQLSVFKIKRQKSGEFVRGRCKESFKVARAAVS